MHRLGNHFYFISQDFQGTLDLSLAISMRDTRPGIAQQTAQGRALAKWAAENLFKVYSSKEPTFVSRIGTSNVDVMLGRNLLTV